MRMKKQPYLPGFCGLGVVEFGGSLIKGNPREARPLSTKKPIHLVMRSSLAKGQLSFLKGKRMSRIERAVKGIALKKGVKVYRYANSGNHLHLVISSKSRRAFNSFIRAISGIIARITLGVERGKAGANAAKLARRFWDARPYTKILEWGKEFKAVSIYVTRNTLEALGFIDYRPRKTSYG